MLRTREEVRAALDARARHYVGLGADQLVDVPPDDLPHVAAIPHLFALAGEPQVPVARRPTSIAEPGADAALATYVAYLDRAVAVAAATRWHVGPRVSGPDDQLVAFTEVDPIQIHRGERPPVFVSLTQYLRPVATAPGAWSVDIEGYFYTLSVDARHHDPLAVWHWHPSREAAPHLHEKLDAGDGRIPRRIPTGWARLGSVVAFAVDQFDATSCGDPGDVHALETSVLGPSCWSS